MRNQGRPNSACTRYFEVEAATNRRQSWMGQKYRLPEDAVLRAYRFEEGWRDFDAQDMSTLRERSMRSISWIEANRASLVGQRAVEVLVLEPSVYCEFEVSLLVRVERCTQIASKRRINDQEVVKTI